MALRPVAFFILSASLTPSCVFYDAALLEEAVGGEGDGDGDSGTGGSDAGGSGAGPSAGGGSGGAPGGSGGGQGGSGGSSPGGDGGGGGADSGGGAQSGGGGPSSCAEPSGKKGPIAGVAAANLIEDFNRPWSSIGAASPVTGQSYVARDTAGTGIGATIQASHDDAPCAEAGDHSLHVGGTGYTMWGATFDANLMFDVAETDQSAFSGATFWARSDDSDQITGTCKSMSQQKIRNDTRSTCQGPFRVSASGCKFGFSDGDATHGDIPIEAPAVFMGTTWEQHFVEIPATVVMSKLTIVHLVASADAAFDFGVDDLTFCADP